MVRCFGSQDRATRIGLLQNLHTFAEHLTPALVEKEIFPQLQSGFTDSVPALRELSAKSLVFLVPKLSDKVINSQVRAGHTQRRKKKKTTLFAAGCGWESCGVLLCLNCRQCVCARA